MPYAKSRKFRKPNRSVRRKKPYSRRRRYRANTTRLLRGPVATRAIVKMNYSEVFAMPAATTGAIGKYGFRANDIFDPNLTGTGHNPMGWTQLTSQYNHFTVLGCKMILTPCVDRPSIENAYGIVLSGSSTFPHADLEETLESPRRSFKYGNPQGAETKSVVMKFSTKKFFSCKSVIGDGRYLGTSVASPTEQAYLWCFHVARDGSSTVNSADYLVRIQYLVMWTEPKELDLN